MLCGWIQKKRAAMLLLLAMLVMGSVVTVRAEERSGSCGPTATWRLTDDGTLYIEGTGRME